MFPTTPYNQYSQRPSYRSHANWHNTMEYPYPQDVVYTNPSRPPPFQSPSHTSNKYQVRRSIIPGQHNSYSTVIQNHALQDSQCFASSSLDNKPIMILIDAGSSINLLDKQLYYLLSFVPPLQPIQFLVSVADGRLLLALGITSLSIAIDDNTFRGQLVVTRNILFPVVLGIDFLQTHGGIISFPNNQLYLTNSSPKTTTPPINANHGYNTYSPPISTHNPSFHTHASLFPPTDPTMSLILHQ